MIWVITANSNTCRIYHFDKHLKKITLLKEINHPENKLKNSDYLTTDKPGHYKTDATNGGAYSPHSDPKEVIIDNFAREIAHELNRGRNNHDYKTLIIITPPHMRGLLSLHLDKHVSDLISHDIHKDVTHLPAHELLDMLHNDAQYG